MSAKLSAVTTIVFLVLFQPMLAVAQQAGPEGSPWFWAGHWHLWSGGWRPSWALSLLVLLAVTVCVAVFLAAPAGSKRRVTNQPEDNPAAAALQILNERFARGEIQRQEYEERKRAILTMTAPTGNV